MSSTYRQPPHILSKRSSQFLGVAVATCTPGAIGLPGWRLANWLLVTFLIVQYGPVCTNLHCNETGPRLDKERESRVIGSCGPYLLNVSRHRRANDQVLFQLGEAPNEVGLLVDNEVDKFWDWWLRHVEYKDRRNPGSKGGVI